MGSQSTSKAKGMLQPNPLLVRAGKSKLTYGYRFASAGAEKLRIKAIPSTLYEASPTPIILKVPSMVLYSIVGMFNIVGGGGA